MVQRHRRQASMSDDSGRLVPASVSVEPTVIVPRYFTVAKLQEEKPTRVSVVLPRRYKYSMTSGTNRRRKSSSGQKSAVRVDDQYQVQVTVG